MRVVVPRPAPPRSMVLHGYRAGRCRDERSPVLTAGRTQRCALLVGALAMLAGMVPAPAAAAPPADAAAAAERAAGWLAGRLDARGVPHDHRGVVDVAATAELALALAGAGVEGAAFDDAVAAVRSRAARHLGDGRADDGGEIGRLLLLAAVAGGDPRDFGGVDLIARLDRELREDGPEAGLYSDQAPDPGAQTSRQSLAILGLVAAGEQPPPQAVEWLLDQQCGNGGFAPYRPPRDRTTDDCGAQGLTPTTSATGHALQALAAARSAGGPLAAGLDYLEARQTPDGGFAPAAGGVADPGITGLAVQALVAAGEQPTAARWTTGSGRSAFDALRGAQLGCTAETVHRGALAAPTTGRPDRAATVAGTLGLAAAPFPLEGGAPTGQAPGYDCPFDVVRHAGPTRLGTAQEVARAGFDSALTVVVAAADSAADSLTAAPLAGVFGAPVLTTPGTALAPGMADLIVELGASRVIIVGGPAAVGPEVEDQLRSVRGVTTVERVSGPTRFHTAVAVAERMERAAGRAATGVYVTEGQDPDPGRGWPDTLAVSGLAGLTQRPVLLVTTDTVPAPTASYLRGRGAATIVGGTGAVSDAVGARLDELVDRVDRVGGRDRYETAAAVARIALRAGADPARTWLVTGTTFADALPAGAAAGANAELLVLLDGSSFDGAGPPAAVAADLGGAMRLLRIVGGVNAVGTAAGAAFAAAAGAR